MKSSLLLLLTFTESSITGIQEIYKIVRAQVVF